MPERKQLIAYISPMGLFLALLGLVALLRKIDNSFWLTSAEYWVYPLQTILCGALLIWFWRAYPLHWPARIGLGIAVALFVFLVWVSPQQFFRFTARTDGFNPDVFANQPAPYWITVVFRFVRLAVVVPLMEEVFWRGFLLRYLIDEKFDRVPFGTFSWLSFSAVTVAFTLGHSLTDWPAAIVTGMLYNGIAYWTKSLSTCVVTHAVTNLLLGFWIMQTKQWGFW
jgi:CAAX prenyl protease-like protein